MLIALINPMNVTTIDWINRVPLDIHRVDIKKTLFLKQYIIKIFFKNDSKPLKIRVSTLTKNNDFINQQNNVLCFLKYLSKYKKET